MLQDLKDRITEPLKCQAPDAAVLRVVSFANSYCRRGNHLISAESHHNVNSAFMLGAYCLFREHPGPSSDIG